MAIEFIKDYLDKSLYDEVGVSQIEALIQEAIILFDSAVSYKRLNQYYMTIVYEMDQITYSVDDDDDDDDDNDEYGDNYEARLGTDDGSIRVDANIVLASDTADSGITFRKASTIMADGRVLKQGDLLPTWSTIGNMLNINFKDITDYSKIYVSDQLTFWSVGGYDSAGGIDLFANNNYNLTTIANEGYSVPLNKYLYYMPNFSKLLKDSPQIDNQLRAADGNIYIAPYFDGLDTPEKMFLMNVDYVKALLDDVPAYYNDGKGTSVYAPYKTSLDTTTTLSFIDANGVEHSNTVSGYTAYIPSLTNEKIMVTNKIGNGTENINVTIQFGKDIITRMKNVPTKNGVNLVAEFKDYIDEVYGDYIGAGKLYQQRSDIFTSASACYNADEYIALLRCVKTNPQYLSGYDTIEPFVTRTGEANRQHDLVSITQMFGIRGTNAEKDKLYFDKNGVLQDGRTNIESYNALEKINMLYNEGLIVKDYYKGYGGAVRTEFISNLGKTGQMFAAYDYNPTQTVNNRSHKGEAYAQTAFMPVLPPVAYWDDGDSTTTNYYHFSEDTRQLKTEGWSLLAKEGRSNVELIRLLTLIDRLYDRQSDDYDINRGNSIADIQDYGPKDTYHRGGTIELADGTKVVKFGDQLTNDLNNSALGADGWSKFFRRAVGATHAVGHVRSPGLDYQATSLPGRYGQGNMDLAIEAGAMRIATSYGEGFFKSVPTVWAISTSEQSLLDDSFDYQKLLSFWNESGNSTTIYSFMVVNPKGFAAGGSIPTKQELQSAFAGSNNVYLMINRKIYDESKLK